MFFGGGAGTAHRAICKWYKHHFLLLVLIQSNSLERQRASWGEINWTVPQRSAEEAQNCGYINWAYLLFGGYAERLISRRVCEQTYYTRVDTQLASLCSQKQREKEIAFFTEQHIWWLPHNNKNNIFFIGFKRTLSEKSNDLFSFSG